MPIGNTIGNTIGNSIQNKSDLLVLTVSYIYRFVYVILENNANWLQCVYDQLIPRIVNILLAISFVKRNRQIIEHV